MKGRTGWGAGVSRDIINVFDNWYIIDDRKKGKAIQVN